MHKSLQFGILGPLEVWRGGRRLSIGGPQQRALLVALLLNANRVVSTDRLVTYLWGEQPPAAARSLVQGCVAQLRRVLHTADPADRRLVTRSPGYLLVVDPGELDLDQFEALVETASCAEAATAVETLAKALALWRGPALDGVGVDAARNDAAGLDERRLVIVEQHLEVTLRLGRYAALAAELETHIRAHPLREGLWQLLMLAQYGAGRQADALATYQRLRRLLIDELGVEPSPHLRQLQTAILAGDDALAPYRAPAAPLDRSGPVEPVPAQLPPTVSGFTGRDDHLQTLDGLLSGDGAAAIGIISGTAGVGKTSLAVHWGHRVRSRFPDGQLYVNLRGYAPTPPTRPIDALAGFLQALGTPADKVPTDLETASARYRSLVAGRRMLVVLDNAHSADQVRPLLPGGTGCHALVTSRDRLGGLVARDGARPITLDVLTNDEAIALLTWVLGPHRAQAEDEQTAELARLCARLPLALRITAANLVCQPDRRITDEVAALSAGERLDTLEIEGDRHSAVRAAFDLSYVALAPAERMLFRRLGLVPGPDVTVDAAAALIDDDRAVRPLLDRLVRASLIQVVGPDRYALHDLLRLYASEQAHRGDAIAAQDAAVGRLYDWYLATCEAAARALYPGKLRLPQPAPRVSFETPQAAATWLDAERANLVAAALRAAEHGPHRAAWTLADSLRGYFWLRMYMVDWHPVAAAGLAAAEAASDLPGQAAAHLSLADLARCQGRYPEAIHHYTNAAALAERCSWSPGQAAALGNLGSAYFWCGDLPAAAEQYSRALDIARTQGSLSAQAVRLGNLGLVYWLLGRFTEAVDNQRQALALNRQLGARGNEGVDLANLGECYHALGDLDLARDHLTDALAIHSEVGDRGAEAESRAVLAAVERDAGHLDTALELAQAAVGITRLSGDQPIVANALNVLASVHQRLGDPVEALARYQEALESARASGTRHAELGALIGLAFAALATGDSAGSRDYGQLALDQAQAGGYRVLAADAHAALAAIARHAGDGDGTRQHAAAALDIYRACQYRLGVERVEAALGQVT